MNLQTYSKIFIASILITFLCNKSFAQNGSLTVNTDPKITELLELKKDMEKENKLSDGYTIQLYYGELDKANQILRKYRGSYGNWPASIEYETPNYKVWAGNFASRIEAERALIAIQKSFSSAFILKPERRK
ncbi:SPOR domain-containing protein [Aequorivita vladivostokensis]|uniref:Translation initiation factor IF-2 n=1 Tax=Aequorivita vladivostokensis TaxID=171194 RepID=A0ABR5DLW6_9FLAO|nr:SPOR domain-containing protein [Aequorivita vladivostokensis]KJJ39767.1 translation initiation factor IF-2 [Aequorivita vladivostokensis]MAB57911.1 SPOR domain-containing protein [Aequorivita sp.]MBF32196.1 SPOR domain-containing protein [Aequorivita sp.]|tara:strand:+ start:126530 stop:126925 length:396 start_codon:yes stop_codon:yes gene_type:complete